MLTGKRAFEGSSAASVIAAIMEREAPSVASVAPAALDRIMRRSLAKDPDDRWQTARDLKSALELATEPVAQPAPPARSRGLAWIVAAALGIVALIALSAPWRQHSATERSIHFQIGPPPGARFVLGTGGGSAISPDGRMIAVVAVAAGLPKLWIRSLDSLTARELPGTEGAAFPFWSPDSHSLGFFSGGKLKRIDLKGGTPVTLADAGVPRGGSWNQEGTIVFAPSAAGGLRRVSAAGGATAPFTTADLTAGENGHRWPQFLPGGRQFIYFSQNHDATRNAIFLSSLDHPAEKIRLVASGTGGCYVPLQGRRPAHLVWFRQGALIAQPFDTKAGKLTGDPLPVADGENASLVSGAYYVGFSASDDGTILFSTGIERYVLTWFSRQGKALETVGQPDGYSSIRISPDATRVGVNITAPSGARDVTTMDFARGVQTRLTAGMLTLQPIWSPDGRRVDYNAINSTSIVERSASGSGQPETVFKSPHPVYVDDWSADGRYLLYEEVDESGRMNLWLLPRNTAVPATGKPVPYLKTSTNQINGQFSPDGKWVAYSSDESGSQEVYVQSLPAGEEKWQVSNGGGDFARWRRDGKELFYRALDGRLMAVSVHAAGRGLEFGSPAPLFRTNPPFGPHAYPYDIAADGQRILSLAAANEGDTAGLTVLMNWRSAE
jgi:hypothetical protein